MPKKPQPFSEEELEQIKKAMIDMDIPEWKQGHILALTPFVTPEYSRFLDTITTKNKRIWQLEKLIAIEADKRASDRQKIDIIATQTAEIERLRDRLVAVNGILGDAPFSDDGRIFLSKDTADGMIANNTQALAKEESNANESDR